MSEATRSEISPVAGSGERRAVTGWLALLVMLVAHFGIQLAARRLVVYRQFTDDPHHDPDSPGRSTRPVCLRRAYPRPAGVLLFSWVVVGVSEEIVFRGFFQTALAHFWTGTVPLFGERVPVAGLLAAVIFTVAHISFRTMSADPRQLVLAFVLGVVYAVAYHRTGSLLAPIVAHNVVDGGIVTAEWLVAALAF